MMTMTTLCAAVSALLAAVLMTEAALAHARGRGLYEARDAAASLLLGLGGLAAGAFNCGVYWLLFNWLYQFRVVTLPQSFAALAAAVVLHDVLGYWGHRGLHTVRFFWASHRVHHSSMHFNLGSGLRQGWTNLTALVGWAPFAVLPLLGFSPALIFAAGAVNIVYGLFVHTELVGRLPRPVEFVFVTPSHHRVHHAVNGRYIDANYGNTFILWDRLFGTFVAECAAEPCRYGLVHNVASFNPVRIALAEFVSLGADLVRAPDWRARLGYLFGPPGYSHDGTRRTARMVRNAAKAVPAYCAPHTGRPIRPDIHAFLAGD
jgi:sterol desaturase/sphingolipid hydroxylase (fatty acid hydroxylase superfamily)